MFASEMRFCVPHQLYRQYIAVSMKYIANSRLRDSKPVEAATQGLEAAAASAAEPR
jgi:hypothetical protein